MQPKRSLIYILAALITLPLFGTVAPATTIDIIQTFDFPGATATLPQKISDQTVLIGTTIFSDGTVKAFIYKPLKHKFSPAFAPSFDTGHYTQGRGINFRRHACGESLNASDGTLHGYLMTHPNCTQHLLRPQPRLLCPGATAASDLPFADDPTVQPRCPLVFTPFDLTAALNTIPLGINNLGDLSGTANFSDGTQPAFLSVAPNLPRRLPCQTQPRRLLTK